MFIKTEGFTTKNRITALILAFLFSAIFSACSHSVFKTDSITETEMTEAATTTKTTEETALSETEAETQADRITVTFCAVGDNLIHSPIYNQARRRDTDGGYDFSFAYSGIASVISAFDVALINQETLICGDSYEPSSYPRFNSPEALGNHMIDIGFDVFSIANNHTLDKGEDGLAACLDYWSGKDVLTVGAYRNEADRSNIRTGEVGGAVVSYLSYTEHLNGLSLPPGSEMQIGNANDLTTIEREIKTAKEISDICIVFMHWGIEGYDEVEDYQRGIASRLTEAGADVIIGTHPHVLRSIETIVRSDGSMALCAYSLGNFISAQDIPQSMIGGILTFTVSVDTETRETEITDTGFIPTITHYGANYSDVRIYKLSDYNERLAAEHGVNVHGDFSLSYINEILMLISF